MSKGQSYGESQYLKKMFMTSSDICMGIEQFRQIWSKCSW